MATSIQARPRPTLLIAVVAAAVLALVFVRPAGSAIPAASVVGRVTYADLVGTTDIATPIRSFEFDVQVLDGAMVATFGRPHVVHDVMSNSPHLMLAVATGIHYPTITVTLYRAGTTTRLQQLQFSDVQIVLDQQSQAGPASATPWETVAWDANKVRQTTYDVDGTTLVANACFDIAQRKKC